jgi:hypothetical protein
MSQLQILKKTRSSEVAHGEIVAARTMSNGTTEESFPCASFVRDNQVEVLGQQSPKDVKIALVLFTS